EEIERIHVHRRRRIFESRHRNCARLRMIRRAPRSLTADMVDYVCVLLPLVGNIADVRHRRRASAADSTRTPRLAFPRGDRAALLETALHSCIIGWARAGYHELSVAFVEH